MSIGSMPESSLNEPFSKGGGSSANAAHPNVSIPHPTPAKPLVGSKTMNQVHFILQGKGGVGKSLVASFVAQYLQTNKPDQPQTLPLVCIDTDPINATLTGYKSLPVRRLELMKSGAVDEHQFDTFMEWVFNENANFVIDNGSSSFIPLLNYLIENNAIREIHNAGKRVIVHTVVTGGQGTVDTLHGFSALARQFPKEVDLIVWLNEFFGDIRSINSEGKEVPFEETEAYKKYHDRVSGIVYIVKQTSSTFGQDIEIMIRKKMTFADVMESGQFGIMAKQRLKTVRSVIFNQLATVF